MTMWQWQWQWQWHALRPVTGSRGTHKHTHALCIYTGVRVGLASRRALDPESAAMTEMWGTLRASTSRSPPACMASVVCDAPRAFRPSTAHTQHTHSTAQHTHSTSYHTHSTAQHSISQHSTPTNAVSASTRIQVAATDIARQAVPTKRIYAAAPLCLASFKATAGRAL